LFIKKSETYVGTQKVSIIGMIDTDTHKQKKLCCYGEKEKENESLGRQVGKEGSGWVGQTGRQEGRQGDEFMSTVVVVVWSAVLCCALV
jgi:hypothetical protein